MTPSTTSTPATSTHAIVIGGSIAGLLAARVLSDHFDTVKILERDRLPDGPQGRAGAPQGKHAHNLLVRGLRIMEALFPGFEQALADEGAPVMNYGSDVRVLVTPTQWLPRIETTYASRAASRPMVEWLLRERVMALPNVEICERVVVDGLLLDANKTRVTGVQVSQRGVKAPSELAADFVVDASGRPTRTPEWLEELGFGKPEVSIVDSGVGYATRLYRKPAGFDDWTVLYMPPKWPNPRGGAVFEVENDYWLVSQGGYLRDYPPTDPDGFLNFASTFPQPDLYNAIKDAEPLSDVVSYRNTRNIRYHYQRMTLPTHYAVVGDAVCGFNPVYGQGMSSAAMAAELLGEVIAHSHGDLACVTATFQKKLAELHEDIWLLATMEDLVFISQKEGMEGKGPSRIERMAQMYIGRSIGTMLYDPYIAQVFVEIMNLTKPTRALFHPRVMASVLWHSLTNPPAKRAAATPTQAVSPS